jgi:hypothetical protein
VHYRFVMSPNALVQKCTEAMRIGVSDAVAQGSMAIIPIWKLHCYEATES